MKILLPPKNKTNTKSLGFSFRLFPPEPAISLSILRFNTAPVAAEYEGIHTMKKFTDEDLILYLYKDCTPKMQASIEEAITHDLDLHSRLAILKRTLKQLDKLKLSSPSSKSLKAIINHAKTSNKAK